MFQQILLAVLSLFILTSCSSEKPDQLKISVTTWIGYTPLFYAKEKGWLKPLNIKLLNVSSLSENMYLYSAGNSDAYVGTQYEYGLLKEKKHSLMPIILFDRSNGGDMVMSNVSLKELQRTTKTIDAYLEIDSVNNAILKDFVKKYTLNEKKIKYINQDQLSITTLQSKNTQNAMLVITYVPYNLELQKNGFREVASTKSGLDLFVVDALFTTQEVFHKHQNQFLALKKLIDKAIGNLKNDPDEFYETIKPYMLELEKEEFKESLQDIIWINQELSKDLKNRLHEAAFPIRGLI